MNIIMTITALVQFKELSHFVRCLKEILQDFKENEKILRSNPVYTDTEGTIESVRISRGLSFSKDKANCPYNM